MFDDRVVNRIKLTCCMKDEDFCDLTGLTVFGSCGL